MQRLLRNLLWISLLIGILALIARMPVMQYRSGSGSTEGRRLQTSH